MTEFTKATECNWPAPWTVTPNCPEDCDGGFSWQSCDCCGSHLGGDRHPAVAHNRDTKEEHTKLAICIDCLMFLSNGTEPTTWE